MTVSTLEPLRGAYSIEAWVRSDDTTGTILERVQTTGDGSSGYRLRTSGEDLVSFQILRGGSSATVRAPRRRFGGYTHVVVVVDSASLTLHIDGILTDQTRLELDPPVATTTPFVAGSPGWRGALDEVAVYDYPLAAAQVARHWLASGAQDRP